MKVTVGKVFVTRKWEDVKIERYSGDYEYPFVGSNLEYYDHDGFARENPENDLLRAEHEK